MRNRALGWMPMAILMVGIASAGVDQVQIDLLGRYPLPLRWDNVQGEPLWVTGAKPFRGSGGDQEKTNRSEAGLYRVRLAPGESVTVWVPASEGLRVYRPDARLAPSDLELAVTNGSGLYLGTPVQPSAQGDSLLLPPDWPEERLARIGRPAAARDPLEVALFVSRREALGELAPYRKLLDPAPPAPTANPVLKPSSQNREGADRPDPPAAACAPDSAACAPLPENGAHIGLRASDEASAQPFWPLQAEPPTRIRLRGPARLALEHRLRYPLAETRTRQAYRVYARLDGRPWQALDFAAGIETRRTVWVDGCAETLGRLETGYLELPAGEHELTLESTLPLYARLLAQADPDDLVPGLNAPVLTAAQARAARPVDHRSIWDLSATELARPLDRMTLAEEERVALRLGRDNRYRDGGLTAALALRQAALAHREDPRLGGQARDLLGLFTFYRNLSPANKPSPAPQRLAWLRGRRLLALADRPRELVVAERFAEEALDTLSPAYFLELPPGADLEYRLPERETPSLLRVAVDPAGLEDAVEFRLRYDDQPPISARVQPPELAGRLFLPSPGEVALNLLGARHGAPTADTLGAPFGALNPPAALVAASVMEMPLPASVRRIRIDGASRPLQVALQYRASRVYQLSESEYLDTVRRLGPETVYREFQARLRAAANPARPMEAAAAETGFAEDRDARRELANHWLPLTRLLGAQARHFAAGIARPTPPDKGESGGGSTALAEARRLSQNERWLPALERWSVLILAADPVTRLEALDGQTQALDRLNEEFLAELTLRGTFAHDPDAQVRDRALARLRDRYAAADDAGALLSLAGTAAVRQPDPARLRALAELLLEQGQTDLALMTMLALPPAEWPTEELLRAAYSSRWWRVFDLALESLPDADRRRLWRGYRAQLDGNYPEALRLWREAGSDGRTLAAALEQGLAIRARLDAADPAAREHAVADWSRWAIHHPGPWLWRDADHLVSDHAGAAVLYAVERNLLARTFRALPERPLKLTVFGPARLRLTGRLPHPATAAEQAVDDWLLVRDGDRVERLPVTDDRPSQGLTVVGDATERPGRLISLDYMVGPGPHEIEVAARQRPLLVAPLIWRPERPLLVLPEPTPAALASAALGSARGEPEPDSGNRWARWLPFGWAGIQREASGWESGLREAGLPARVATGCRLEPVPSPAPPRIQPDTDASRTVLQRVAALNPDLAWPEPPLDPAQILRNRLIAALWEVEQRPEQLASRLPALEQAAAAQAGTPGIEALLRRLRRRAGWEPMLSVAHGAGLRYLDMHGWQPETPLLRVRKALAPAAEPNEQVLFGAEQLGLLSTNPTPTRLRLDLRVMDLRYLPPQPLAAWYRLDDGPERAVTLAPDASIRSLAVTVPPGEHVLRIGLDDPVANQFLRVRVDERQGRSFRPVTDDLKRLYQIATAAEPWRTRLEGPAWLRIDEWRDGATDSRYRYLGAGLHDLVLRPAPGQAESLFRVHRQQVFEAPRETTPPRVTHWTLEPVPVAVARVPTPALPSAWVTTDRYALGEQQAGTWGLGTTLARSIPPPGEGSGPPDEYLELTGDYRYRDDAWRNDYEMEALYRLHRLGSPTFGLSGLWQHETDWPGVSFQLGWTGYAQQSGTWAWNSTVRGQIRQRRDLTPELHHAPSLGFFARDLHQQAGYDYRPGHVDQDVFSAYKSRHRRGLVLADTLVHRPWLDTLWYGRAALNSDEHWNLLDPEQFDLGVGWKQWLGGWRADVAYDWTYYFAQGDHDWNRPNATQNHTLSGGLLWDRTWGGQGRLNLELRLQYDLDDREYGAWLSVNWFPDRGRGYRDFRGVDFRDLRERRLPLEFNNRLDAPPGEDDPR